MANTIKLKRASGSDPSASDLVVGEVAVRTDTAKLFTKKDDNSVAEIGITALGDNDVTTAKIADDAVTYAKIQNVSATDRLLGRDSSGAGVIEEIAPSAVRTMLGLATSATTDTTNASNIGSGTLAAARVATLNQDTTGNAASADSVDVSGVTTDAALQVLFSTSNDGQAKTIAVDSTSSKFTYNPSSNTLTVDTVVAALTGNVTGNASGSSGSCTGNAATATALANARTIAGVSFDGTANISLNNNAITNGASYITSSGTSAACSGNAATATKLAATKTIAGVAFDGSANISLNNNAITNGAGYITSADGGNAATLDSIDSSQFLRSDTADTASGVLSISLGLSFGANSKCAAAVSSLSDGGTITVDFESGIHHSVTLGGNRTLSADNEGNTVGQSGSIFITQDGTGSRTLAYTSDYKFAGGTAPTLSTAANAVDRLDYVVKADGVVHCVVTLDVK